MQPVGDLDVDEQHPQRESGVAKGVWQGVWLVGVASSYGEHVHVAISYWQARKRGWKSQVENTREDFVGSVAPPEAVVSVPHHLQPDAGTGPEEQPGPGQHRPAEEVKVHHQADEEQREDLV